MLVTTISIVIVILTILYLWRETKIIRNILNKKRVEPFIVNDIANTINDGTSTVSTGICSNVNNTDRPQNILTLNDLSEEITDGLQHISDNVAVYHKSLV